MAKEDFCFTYYDGDAARDMAHMNRLERGGYGDIIIAQRKFGHLSLSLIKKILGNDFDQTWEAIEIILSKDEEGKFFISWLDNSVEKMKKHSAHQSENGKKGGRPKTQTKPNSNPNETQTPLKKKPLEDGNGYGYEDGNGIKEENFGKSENLLNGGEIIPTICRNWYAVFPSYTRDQRQDFPAVQKIIDFMQRQHDIDIGDATARDMIIATLQQIAENIRDDPKGFWVNKPIKSIANNIQEQYNKIKNPVQNGKRSTNLRNDLEAALNKRFAGKGQT